MCRAPSRPPHSVRGFVRKECPDSALILTRYPYNPAVPPVDGQSRHDFEISPLTANFLECGCVELFPRLVTAN